MRQCIFVIGTRAQLVKISPVLRRAVESGLRHTVWFTGQHHESIDDLVDDFSLTSDIVRPASAKERSSIGELLWWIPGTLYRCYRYVKGVRVRTKRRPLVVVHGDTLSTWLGAVAGSWGGGDIVHLESGLSSGKWSDPFPEEILRRLTFRRAQYALCPNDDAAARMRIYAGCVVVNTQENTLLDCVRYALEKRDAGRATNEGAVVSIHRFQNIYHQQQLQNIVTEMISLAAFGTVRFILHPPTELRLRKYGLFEMLERTNDIQLLPRMPYSEFLALMSNARVVFSDGGSNQEELSYLGVPAVLYRERSERPDGLGGNIVFRHELSGTPAECMASGEIDSLRADSRINDTVQPSRMTVDALMKWANGLDLVGSA